MCGRRVCVWSVRMCLTMQASDQGVDGPVGSGQIAARSDASCACTRPSVSASSHKLLSYLARLRHACHRRRHDSRPELSQRDDQERRQTLWSTAATCPCREGGPLQACVQTGTKLQKVTNKLLAGLGYLR